MNVSHSAKPNDIMIDHFEQNGSASNGISAVDSFDVMIAADNGTLYRSKWGSIGHHLDSMMATNGANLMALAGEVGEGERIVGQDCWRFGITDTLDKSQVAMNALLSCWGTADLYDLVELNDEWWGQDGLFVGDSGQFVKGQFEGGNSLSVRNGNASCLPSGTGEAIHAVDRLNDTSWVAVGANGYLAFSHVCADVSAPTVDTAAGAYFCSGDSVMVSITPEPGYEYTWYWNDTMKSWSGNSVYLKEAGELKVAKKRFECEVMSAAITIQKKDSADCDTSTSLQELADEGMQIYPNPARETLQLRFAQAQHLDYIRILNIQGRIVWQRQVRASALSQESIELFGLESGMYVLDIQLGNQSHLRRKYMKE